MRMESVPIKSIDMGDRNRENYHDLDKLARSIDDQGLICPIAIYIHPDIEGAYILAAGGRRLAAHKLLGRTEILCRIFERKPGRLELKTIELIENIEREDFTWPEKIKLEREIHNLQLEIKGPKTSTAPDAEGQSLRDTAELLGVSHGKLSQDFSLADAMDAFPEAEWNKCKNQSEATQLKVKIEDTIFRKHMAKQAEKIIGLGDERIKKLSDSYIIGDFFAGIAKVQDEVFDIIEIDPPYAIELETKKKASGISKWYYGEEGYNEIDAKDYPEFMFNTFKECYRVAKPNSWLICWFGPDPWFESIYQWLIEAGWGTTRLTGKWRKPNGQSRTPRYRLANADEQFFYCWKGSPQLAKPGSTNGFDYSPVSPAKKTHPTERPIEMIEDILTTFGKEGSRVLVPYLGSGNTLLAAARCKMVPIGFDLTKAYKEGYVIKLQNYFGKGKEN